MTRTFPCARCGTLISGSSDLCAPCSDAVVEEANYAEEMRKQEEAYWNEQEEAYWQSQREG